MTSGKDGSEGGPRILSASVLLDHARDALADTPQVALGREKASRWRAPRIVRVGAAWHLGVLLLSEDAVYATAEVLRAADEGRRGYTAESARARAVRRAQALRGGFAPGEVVHVGGDRVDLDAVDSGSSSGPLVTVDGIVSVRWSASGGFISLEAYLADRLALIVTEGSGF